jgi:hypothetical protein
MENPRRSIWIFLPILLLVLLIGVRHRTMSATLNGTWLKTSGGQTPSRFEDVPTAETGLPEEVTLRMVDDRFTMKWRDGSGVSYVNLSLDGKEHILPHAFGTRTYRAEFKDGTLLITRYFKPDVGFPATANEATSIEKDQEWIEIERWATADNGRRLVVSSGGKEITFRRSSVLRSLFVASP